MCNLGFWEYTTQNVEGFLFQQKLQLPSSGLMERTVMFANIGENLEHSKTSAAKT
jgi:hypothetical protein